MRRLDPRIHRLRKNLGREIDCRVELANDEGKREPYPPIFAISASDTSKLA